MFLTAIALTLAAPQQCRAYDTGLPRALRGWTRSGTELDTGHAVTLRGGRDRALSTSLRIRKAGIFGIALDQAAWIDVTRDGEKPLGIAAEGRGPRCSTIRKIVRYRLRPGSYRVSVRRLSEPRARLMLVRY